MSAVTLYDVIQGKVDALPGMGSTAATLPSNPSPLSEAGGRVLQFCRFLGCLDAEEVAATERLQGSYNPRRS